MKKSIICCLLALVMALALPAAAEEAAVEIYTPEDLYAMAENPAGSYILMADLDMAGMEWKSLDFSGTFDGNGHSILNLTLSQPGDETPEACDGNRILYESQYVGLFGTLRNAVVKNLNLLNVRAVVASDAPCFLGGIAGYAEGSVISDCTVTGCLELRAHDRIFGVGGLVGYGGGTVERCRVDVTLICVDTDAATKDEQFLGGVYATGFMDVIDCEILIDGYVSEHGYAHNGGVTGMYMEYPLGTGEVGHVTGNSVTGKITFFEDNTNRRAYCAAYFGEILVNNCSFKNNLEDFQRDEVFDYSQELRPEICPEPSYRETVTPSACDTFGYTVYTCETCGYTYTDRYTLYSHTVTTWSLTQAPTVDSEGLSVGYCDGCGLEFQRTEPKLEPEPTETTQLAEPSTTETEPETEAQAQNGDGENTILPLLLPAAALCILALLLLGRKKRKPGKYQK